MKKKRWMSLALSLAMIWANIAPVAMASEVQATEAVETQQESGIDQTEQKQPEDGQKRPETKISEAEPKQSETNGSETNRSETAQSPQETESSDQEERQTNAEAQTGVTEPATGSASEPETDAEPATESESETSVTDEVNQTEAKKDAETLPEETAVQTLLHASGRSAVIAGGVSETIKFVPGTYTVSANLYVPEEDNPILSINAYLTNPANPLGIGGVNGIPKDPVTDNAILTIGEDGTTKTLTVGVVNPVFTLQAIGSGSNVTVTNTARDSEIYASPDGKASKNGRITQITVELLDNSGAYQFANCQEFPTILGADWTVALKLGVDLTAIPNDTTVEMTSGDGGSWAEGDLDGLSFLAKADVKDLQQVLVDGTALPAEQYTAFSYSGQTWVELNLACLSALAGGTHRLTLQYADGFVANASFTVEKKETETPETDPTGTLAAGTYQITANLYLPGELNTELPGTTAYLTNPSNPLGIGGHDGIPMTPVSDNATLVVGADGTKTVIVDVVNPVFTLQKITSGDTITVVGAVRDKEIYTGVSQTTSRTSRITKLYLELKDDKGVYQFGACTEFPTLLETDWNVPLQLSVDFTSAKKTSDSTDTGLPSDAGNGSGNDQTETESESQTETETETESEKKNNTKDTDPNSGTGTLKPGTYTVAVNIWIDKASSGLPLNPHLTSSVFPPKDPVSNNAQVMIDQDGHATVKVPIVIPSKVMSVKSISGLNIISSSSSGGYLTSITVDLGKVTNPNAVITKSCTVSLDLGELAQTIAKKGREQVWAATFQVNFSGVPSGSSGGGNVDVNALIADASKTTTTTATGTNIRIGVREDVALAALLPMMSSHKDDKEIQAQTSTAQSSTATGAKNSYLFTIERLSDIESIADLTDEERQEALFVQYQKHFTDGTYDLVLVSPEEAEELCKDDASRGTFEILALIEYAEKDESSVAADDQSESDATKSDAQMLLVSKRFLNEHAATVTDILKEVQTSASEANANPEQTAVSLVTLGIGSDSAAAQELLKNHTASVISGKELQEAVSEFAQDEAYAELEDESLCYVVQNDSVNTNSAANSNATAQSSDVNAQNDATNNSVTTQSGEVGESVQNNGSDSVNGSGDAQTSEKIEITDEDSLSAALDAALAKKKESADDTDDGTADAQSSSSVTVSNSSGLDLAAEQTAAEALTPGTYTVSANLYLPGERNMQLPGTTAYMTNPDNPLGIGGHDGIPMTPVSDNATLVVAEDGTKTVTLDVVNPVFTLQKIAKPENSAILEAARDEERYEGTNGVGVDGRITKLTIRLGDDTALYPFDDCVEFPTLLETDWNVLLELSVEFTTAQKVSDSTEVDLMEATIEATTDTQQ